MNNFTKIFSLKKHIAHTGGVCYNKVNKFGKTIYQTGDGTFVRIKHRITSRVCDVIAFIRRVRPHVKTVGKRLI